MALSTFKQGLSLPTWKYATEGKPVELAPYPPQVVIPINQHFGAPNQSLVSVGDTMVRGQKIAEGALTVPVHASISGTVYVKVIPYQFDSDYFGTGTYAIVYSAGSSMP